MGEYVSIRCPAVVTVNRHGKSFRKVCNTNLGIFWDNPTEFEQLFICKSTRCGARWRIVKSKNGSAKATRLWKHTKVKTDRVLPLVVIDNEDAAKGAYNGGTDSDHQ